MKQKLFLGALLLGALTLNSCVDDTESASVTAVRQAKAEQLKSLADLNKANAEAALITANATKAAQEAQAEYLKAQAQFYQAQAAYEQAKAEWQNAQTEKDKEQAAIDLEKKKLDLEKAQLAMDNYKKELEVIAAELEQRLMIAKVDIEKQKNELQAQINKADKEKQQELQILLNRYNKASQELFEVQKTLASNEVTLAQLKAGVISAKEAAQKAIDKANSLIAEYEQQILANEDAIKTLEASYSPTEADEKLTVAERERDVLINDKDAKQSAKNAASSAETKAVNALASSPYVTEIKYDFLAIYCGDGVSPNWQPAVAINGIAIEYDGTNQYYSAKVPAANGGEPTVIKVVSKDIREIVEVEYKYEGDDRSYFTTYSKIKEYYTPVANGFENYVKAVQASIAADQGKKESDAKTALDKANADLKTAEADYKTKNDAYEAAKKATAAAQKAYDDAVAAGKPAAETDPLNAKLTLAKSAEATAKIANDAAKTILGDKATDTTDASGAYKAQADKELAYNNAKAALKVVNDQLAEIQEAWGYAIQKASTNDAYIAAANKAIVASTDAKIAYYQVEAALTKKTAEVTALEFVTKDPNVKEAKDEIERLQTEIEGGEMNVWIWDSSLNAYVPTPMFVGGLKEKIEKQKAVIENQTKVLNDPNNTGKEKEIAETEAEIAANKAEIEILQKKVDLYKAQLEKAMESDEPVNPAPAE